MDKLHNIKLQVFLTITLVMSFVSLGNAWVTDSPTAKKAVENKPASYYTSKPLAPNSSVAKVTAVDKVITLTIVDPYSNKSEQVSVGTFKGTVDGTSAAFYCIDISHPLAMWTTSEPNTYTDNGNTAPKITYVMNNYYPFKTYPYTGSMGTVEKEAASVQLAIWYFSDGLDLSKVTGDAAVVTRARAIIADAEANGTTAIPFQTLIITPTNQTLASPNAASFTVTALNTDNQPISGLTVTLATTSGTLSTTSVVTNASGNATFTLSQGGFLSATVSASASVTIPQGTKYVHSIEPDLKQKLVLATPAKATKTSSATVNWYTPNGGCDLNGFATYTQGGWGSPSNSGPGIIRDTYFTTVFPTGMTIGGNYTIKLTSAAAVMNFLPQGGTAAALTQNYTNPTTQINVLAGQVAALTLNVAYSNAGKLGTNTGKLGDLVIVGGAFAGKTVNQFLAIANTALGGGNTGFTFTAISDAATALNENFDNGTVDQGYVSCEIPKASLGDKVWLDSNNNGIQDAGENGVAGVTVKLYDCNNVYKATTTTDANGLYAFANLTPGSYYVEFTLPSGYSFSPADQGSDDAKDSDANISTGKTDCVTLVGGQNNTTLDAGIYQCLNTIGDFVWRDANANGVQDAGEAGIQGVVVELLNGTTVVATTTTNASGFYQFTNIANGTYTVKIAASNFTGTGVLASSASTKWYASPINQGGNDAKDSDGNVTAHTASVTVNCANNNTIDFGFYKTCISFQKTGTASVKLGETITYTFRIENCGDIVLHGGVDVVDPLLKPDGDHIIANGVVNPGQVWTFTKTYTPTANDCGSVVNEATAIGHPVLPNGTALSEYPTMSSSWTTTVDCSKSASLGDKVWLDVNKNGVQDAGESGVANVTVKLYDCSNNTLVDTKVTDANGNYLFNQLNPGSYKVVFVLGANYFFTLKDTGGDDAKDSDADATTGETTCYTLIGGQTNLTVDAGVYYVAPKSSLGDYVWNDVNKNGIQESGENGIANVTVELHKCSDNSTVATTVTDANGKYLFSNLDAGDYYVKFVLVSGYTFSPINQGTDDAKDSDVIITSGKTDCIILAAGENNMTVDAGMYQCLNTIGDFVWRDANANGIQDAGEAGIQGVVVELLNGSTVVATTTTNASGFYQFANIVNGTYTVRIAASNFTGTGVLVSSASTKWYASPANQGTVDAKDSDGDVTAHTATVTLSCSDNPTIDFGFYKTCMTFQKSGPATVKVGETITYTFRIENCGDLVLHGGVDVFDALLNPSGDHKIANKIVNPGEVWEFTKTYVTTSANCGNLVNDAQAVGHPVLPNGTYVADLTMNSSWTTIVDCNNSASLGDKVWLDTNKNGIQDAGETGVANVTVKLIDCSNNTVIATKITDANGNYLFTNLNPGSYKVEFVLPGNYLFTLKDVQSDDAKDSDADLTTGQTTCYTIVGGQTNLTIDAGLYPKPGGECDLNGMTTFTQGGWGSSSNSAPGQIRDTYFSTVFPAGLVIGGTYTITLTNAAAVVNFLPQGGTAAALTHSYTNPTTTESGVLGGQVAALALNVGFSAAGKLGTNTTKLGDLVIVTGPFTGKTVSEFLAIANAALGGANTGYSFSDINAAATALNENFDNGTVNNGYVNCLAPKASLGDKVWIDVNKNGIQDLGEVGLAGVTVQLYDCTGSTLIATRVTDYNGNYLFSNLAPGDYKVKFILPANYFVTIKDAGTNDAVDSDVDAATGFTGCYTLAAGDNNLTVDAGVYYQNPKATLGDKIWIDADKDGVQGIYEVGLAGVTVQLFACDGTTVLKSMITDWTGNYLFTDLEPGSYKVKFILPANYYFTVKDAGTNDAVDSDADLTTGLTGCYTLAAGDDNRTVDAGVYYVNPKVTIGDKVWIDTDKDGVQDAGELGIANVTVQLYDCNTSVMVSSMVTTATGNYLFTNLNPGSYKVKFILPANYYFTVQNAGTDDAVDSDADVVLGETTCYTLNPGDVNLTVDAGVFYTPPQTDVDLRLTKTASNLNPKDGDQITYTITVTNYGPATATGVVATDLLPVGLTYVSNTTSQGTYDELTGAWTVGTLANGASATLTITVTVHLAVITTTTFDLGIAKDYNLFVLNDLEQPSSDTQGKVAVGHNATLSNYSVGDRLPNSNGTDDVLIVDNNLTYTSGAVYNGNVVVGGTTNLPTGLVSINNGTLKHGHPINFAAAASYFSTLAAQLAGYTVNAPTVFQWGGLTLTGTDPYKNVFNITGANLSAANNLAITAPNGSVVVVNVSGTNISWTGGFTVSGTSSCNVLFNFYEATSLRIQGIDVTGSILAPFADVNFVSGVQNGQMIAKNVHGIGQFNHVRFLGNIPTENNILNVAEVTACDQNDGNSIPGNGVPSENDYGSVTIHITQSGSGTGSGNGNWTQVGTFTSGEVVWTIKVDASGLLLAGTLCGKIYSSNNNGLTWTVINGTMNVHNIWAIVTTNTSIFAATEQGVYVSTNNGAMWTNCGLAGKDVRALALGQNGVIYAGAWGAGVYKSTDNGSSWTEVNSGLTNLNVDALTVTSANVVYAGTFGAGVFKSLNQGATWVNANIGYDFVWSLGVTASGNIIAGTYGAGIYRSTNNGSTWDKANTGLPARFIYAITIDASDKIYLSTFEGGIFGSSDGGATWNNLGMGGCGASSVAASSKSKKIYVGTNNGAIYQTSDGVTDVKLGSAELPAKFELHQNFPNPFNPSTVIKFNVPVSGQYIMKVYNVIGQLISTLANGYFDAGSYTVNFDASGLPSGLYIYQMTGKDVNITKKMVLQK